jgi:hypothetical protein
MISQHPLYQLERRRVRWAYGDRQFLSNVLRVLALSVLLIVVAWMIVALLVQSTSSGFSSVYFGQDVYVFIIAVTIFIGFTLDFVAMSASTGTINSEIQSGRWDLLRLTALNDVGIVSAKHAVSQVRSWRTMMMMVGFRLGLVLIGLFLTLQPLLEFGGFEVGLNSFVNLLVFLIMICVFVLEPYWRMQALTAVGLYLSSMGRSATATFLSGFFGLLLVWFVQIFVTGAAMFGAIFLSVSIAASSIVDGFGGFFGLWFTLLWLAILVGAVFGFYYLLERWSLRQALMQVRRRE